MRRFLLFVSLIAASAAQAEDYSHKLSGTNEIVQPITTTTGDIWVQGGAGEIAVTLADNGETVVVNPQLCSSKSSATCDEFLWDHDGNGTATQSELDGDGSTVTRGTNMPAAAFYRFTVTTAPGSSNVAALVVARRVAK